MRPLSATEAISPAIDHTKRLLQPFSLGLWLKLGLVALLAEMGSQFLFPPTGTPSSSHPTSSPAIGSAVGGLTPLLITVFIIFGVFAFLLGLALFYLSSRMQLVLMDLVATSTTFVSPAWDRTASKTWPWIGIRIAIFIAILIIFVVLAAPLIYFFHSTRSGNAQPPTPALLGTFALIFVVAFLVIFALLVIFWALRDFVLPFLLFEDATVATALQNAISLIRREPGPVSFYLFMKLVLSIAAGIAAELCILVAVLIIGLPAAAIGGGLWFALHQSGTFGTAIMYISFALLGLVVLVVFLAAALCIGGATLIFYQAYALYFIGGRIPIVGNLLQPPPPPSGPPPAVPPMAPVLP